MAINKFTHSALKLITSLETDIKKTYKMERQLERLTARMRGKPRDFTMWDHDVTVEGCSIPVRIFKQPGTGKQPLMLFIHGGGWVTGGIEHYSGVCVDLAKATNTTVASIDYRLAPEHKFPIPAEDCYAVTREFFCGRILDYEPGDITLIGDSAGGNLAAAVSLMARDRGEFIPKRQILIYPSTYNDHSENSPFESVRENGTDYILTSKRVNDAIELYRSCDDDLQNPYFAPLIAKDFTNQPRTLIITAEYCPLRDEGEAYGEALRKAGNDVTTVCLANALHAYLMLPPRFTHVRQTHQIINAFLERE